MDAVRHRFTVAEYRKMGDTETFSEDDRVELMYGEVVKMAPIGDRHIESVMRLTRLISRWTLDTGGPRLFVSVQNPLALGEHGEPQPDLTLLQRRGDRSGIPSSEEVLLVVEVAATSLIYDRETNLPLYAEAGIPEAWLVDLTMDATEVYTEPGSGGSFAQGAASEWSQTLSFDATEALPPQR